MVKKRRILLGVFLLMVIRVTAQTEQPDSSNTSLYQTEYARTKFFHTPIYRMEFIKNYCLMFRISDRDLQQRAYLTATKEPKVKRPYYSLTVPYPFDAKKLNLPKYSIPKETAADIILGIADLFLNLAFPGWEDVDL